MAYDPDLADRIRALAGADPSITETRMFGGLAFLVHGHLAIAASGQGGILVRVDPADGERFAATTAATIAVMRGRPMAGWLRVADDDVRTARQLRTWFERGTRYAASLPPKPGTT